MGACAPDQHGGDQVKINVTLSIEVSPEAWLAAGANCGESTAEVREDVREYVLYSVQGLYSIETSEAKVTLK